MRKVPTEFQTSRNISEQEGPSKKVYYSNHLVFQLKKPMLRRTEFPKSKIQVGGKFRTRTQLSCFPIQPLDFFRVSITQVIHSSCTRHLLNEERTLWPREASFQRSPCPCDGIRQPSLPCCQSTLSFYFRTLSQVHPPPLNGEDVAGKLPTKLILKNLSICP